MKKSIVIIGMLLATGSLLAAEADAVKAAAKKLAASSYSWTTKVTVPEGSQFRPGPTEGKAEKDGNTCVSMTFGENTTVAIFKGEKGAVKTQDGWQSLSELTAEGQSGRGSFLGRWVRNYKAPAAEAEDLAGKVKELKKDGDVYAGDLTEEGAKALLTMRGGRAGGSGNAPEPKNAKASAKFTVKDGTLTKYEYTVKGTVNRNGEDRDIERTTTVEIKDVGTTKIEVPAEAKAKLG
jgi:hypothetical protein